MQLKMFSLPKYIKIEIMAQLSLSDLFQLRQTCKLIYQLANIDIFWSRKTKIDYPKCDVEKPLYFSGIEWYKRVSRPGSLCSHHFNEKVYLNIKNMYIFDKYNSLLSLYRYFW